MKNYIKGLVSVVIPTYKRCDMLGRAIASVLNQTYKNIELIVVNDNAKNDSYSMAVYQIINFYSADKRLIFVEQETHVNGAVARNVGIKKAKGEYIAFLDDDDYWESDKIQIQISTFLKLPNDYGAVSCLKKYYKNGAFVRASLPYKDGFVFKRVVCFLTNITTGTALIKRKALDDCGYFDERLKRQQDFQLFSFLTKKYKIKLVKRYLLNIDISDGQNRPALDVFLDIKEAFIQSVKPIIDKRIESTIRSHVKFSYTICLFKNKKILKALINLLSNCLHPIVFFTELSYYIKNTFEVTFKNINLKKFNYARNI